MFSNSRTPLRTDRVRPLNQPRPVMVQLDEHGLPERVTEVEREFQVEAIGEVWRIDDEWWRTPISRRYVEVVAEGGGHLMLYQDLTQDRWYAQRI